VAAELVVVKLSFITTESIHFWMRPPTVGKTWHSPTVQKKLIPQLQKLSTQKMPIVLSIDFDYFSLAEEQFVSEPGAFYRTRKTVHHFTQAEVESEFQKIVQFFAANGVQISGVIFCHSFDPQNPNQNWLGEEADTHYLETIERLGRKWLSALFPKKPSLPMGVVHHGRTIVLVSEAAAVFNQTLDKPEANTKAETTLRHILVRGIPQKEQLYFRHVLESAVNWAHETIGTPALSLDLLIEAIAEAISHNETVFLTAHARGKKVWVDRGWVPYDETVHAAPLKQLHHQS
jgi:hypothetical protein